jgi:hypothetical protein
MTPQNFQEMMAYIQQHRTTTGSFDVVANGHMYEKEPVEATELLREYASAGVTWWLESFWPDVPLDSVKAVVEQGPPHL